MTLIEKILQMKGDAPRIVFENICVEGGGRYEGFEYLIIFRPFGHRCGYVVIPQGFRTENNKYDELDVHGGITFYDYIDSWFHCYPEELFHDSKTFCIGFDTAHWDDGYDMELSKEIWPEDNPHSMKNIRKESFEETNQSELVTIKTYEFMEAQCKHLIDQLMKK